MYAAYARSSGTPQIDVSQWNGTDWRAMGDPSDSTSSTISTVDIAVHEGHPVVAFVENNVLKVKKYIDDTNIHPGVELPGLPLLLLDD